MRHFQSFGDKRQVARCAFCGGNTESRDHCPSKVLLDEPYPDNLPVVPACEKCNSGFSADEEYFACLLAYVLTGSTSKAMAGREKVKKMLSHKPTLKKRLESAQSIQDDQIVWNPEMRRILSVVTKLAKGHSLYEVNEPQYREPDHIRVVPILILNSSERQTFEASPFNPSEFVAWPEVGSRAMQRIANGEIGWIEVQNGRYRFRVEHGNGIQVRIVIHEYLACEVIWEDG